MELKRPPKPGSQNGQAVLTVAELRVAGGVALETKVIAIDGETVTVKISPATLEYLESIASSHRARELVKALPYCDANNQPRVQALHIAMAHGARTPDDFYAWLTKHGVYSRRTRKVTPSMMQLPDVRS